MISRDKVTVVADSAEQREQIDVARAQKAREQAKKKLFSHPPVGAELEEAQDALARAEARLKVAQLSG